MPEWAWILALFIAITAAYIAGFCAGTWRSDRSPNPAAWLKAREYDCDCRKEIALQSLRNEHEWELKALERGVYDHIPFDGNEETEETED